MDDWKTALGVITLSGLVNYADTHYADAALLGRVPLHPGDTVLCLTEKNVAMWLAVDMQMLSRLSIRDDQWGYLKPEQFVALYEGLEKRKLL